MSTPQSGDDSSTSDMVAGRKLITRRRFAFRGLNIEESVYDWTTLHGLRTMRVMWYRPPFDKMVVNGRKNPIAYADYVPNATDHTAEYQARKTVAAAISAEYADLLTPDEPQPSTAFIVEEPDPEVTARVTAYLDSLHRYLTLAGVTPTPPEDVTVVTATIVVAPEWDDFVRGVGRFTVLNGAAANPPDDVAPDHVVKG